MENRRKYILICLLILLCLNGHFSSVWAQIDFVDEKNKITEIKRNPAYVYGEGMAETMDEALEIAEGSLKSEILRVISEDENLQNTTVFEVGTVRQNSEKVTLKRGTLDRVFLYVAKNCIQPGKNGITIHFQKEEILQLNQPEQQASIVEEKEQIVQQEPEPVEVVETTQEDDKIKLEEVKSEELIPVKEEAEEVILSEPKESTDENEEIQTVTVESDLLQKIIATRSMADMEKLFRAAKEEQLLMWGNVSTTINPSWYLLVYGKEGVKAVLEKGTDNRLNFLTGETEILTDYQSDPKIWFILYE